MESSTLIDFIPKGCFLIFLLVCIVAAIFTQNKDMSKYVGGNMIIILALYANDVFVYGIAVFIVGLVIASEKYMSLMLAFFKGNKDFLQSENFIKMIEHMNPSEVSQKITNELKEIESVSHHDDKRKEKSSLQERVKIDKGSYATIIPAIEENALFKLQKSLKVEIVRQVRINEIMLDGFSYDKKSKVVRFIEVKVFPRLLESRSKQVDGVVINRLRQTIASMITRLDVVVRNDDRFINFRCRLLLVVVLNVNRDFVNIRKQIEELKDEFEAQSSKIKTRFVFYNLKNMNYEIEELGARRA